MPTEMQLHVVAGLLRQGRTLDRLSTSLTVIGALAGVMHVAFLPPAVLAAFVSAWLIMLGLMQKYWAMRVALDAHLFNLLATDIGLLAERTQALDHALIDLELLSVDRVARPWAARLRGAMRLLRVQALMLTAQTLPVVIVLCVVAWLPSSF